MSKNHRPSPTVVMEARKVFRCVTPEDFYAWITVGGYTVGVTPSEIRGQFCQDCTPVYRQSMSEAHRCYQTFRTLWESQVLGSPPPSSSADLSFSASLLAPLNGERKRQEPPDTWTPDMVDWS